MKVRVMTAKLCVPLKDSLSSVYSSNSRLNLLQKRKRLGAGDPPMPGPAMTRDRYVAQRVLSAKTHRVKQLQSQLAEAHYHLQELNNENRVLRTMQKKQEIALQRYENSNAELPQVLNSHSEELRVQQSKYKQLKQQHKELTQKLKERDLQLQQLRDEHEHLLELTRDKNLPEREKLHSQVSELSLRVQQQNETINTLQRRINLEAKNFRVQLQNEIMKHKDTRHDLDMAISNADKLSTIIELKEKMLSTAAARNLRSPTKAASSTNVRPAAAAAKTTKTAEVRDTRSVEERDILDYSLATRMCENSRTLASALSHDEEVSSMAEPRSKFTRSRSTSLSTNSKSTPGPTRKNSKGPEEILELSKTVQEGMAGLSMYDQEIDFQNSKPEEVQLRIQTMKADLMSKIIHNDDILESGRKTSDGSAGDVEEIEMERPKSRGTRHSAVSFYGDMVIEEHKAVTLNNYKTGDEMEHVKLKKEKSTVERKMSGKSVDKYCKDMMQDIEKSNKVINRHMKDFNQSRIVGDKLAQQLEAVDKINEYVSMTGHDIPDEALVELNNNFKTLSEHVSEAVPVPRKRSISGRNSAKVEPRTNLFGDSSMSNQDLLNDLLGKN